MLAHTKMLVRFLAHSPDRVLLLEVDVLVDPREQIFLLEALEVGELVGRWLRRLQLLVIKVT